jgi:hypothetical protein
VDCLVGDFSYWIDVPWRVEHVASHRQLATGSTRCAVRSARAVGDWLAAPDAAAVELATALAATGSRIAEVLAAPEHRQDCTLRLSAEGALVPR